MPLSSTVKLGLLLVTILLLTTTCIDTIEFDRPKTFEGAISIQGKLAKGATDYIRVSIRKVFDFSNGPALIRAKEVTLIDESGNKIDIPSRQEGIHFLNFQEEDGSFSIDYDKCYQIELELFDGRTYLSGLECLMAVPTPTQMKVSKVEIDIVNAIGELEKADQLEFRVDTPLKNNESEENVRLLWELEMTYKYSDSPEFYSRSCFPIRFDSEVKTCFFTESPFVNYIPLDGTQINNENATDELVWKALPSFLFAEGFYLVAMQQSLTKTAFTYWNQVNQLVSRTTGLFESPDAKVVTNFVNTENPKEEVYGYFYATEEKLMRTYVAPRFAGNPRPFCPEPMPFGNPPPTCCNCLTHPNSTLEKPDWWIE